MIFFKILSFICVTCDEDIIDINPKPKLKSYLYNYKKEKEKCLQGYFQNYLV